MKFLISSLAVVLLSLSSVVSGDGIREIHVMTSDCTDCGMTNLGQLTAKVCGQGDPEQVGGRCCIALHMESNQDNYEEGDLDIFAGPDSLEECYNFDLGEVLSKDDLSLTLYHSGSDGGKFDFARVITNENHFLQCNFGMFMDGTVYYEGTDCQFS